MRKTEIADEIFEYFDLIEKQLECCRALLKLLLVEEEKEDGKETMDKRSYKKKGKFDEKG